eukprot:jgi/Bigna1/145995/aug1.107_g20703
MPENIYEVESEESQKTPSGKDLTLPRLHLDQHLRRFWKDMTPATSRLPLKFDVFSASAQILKPSEILPALSTWTQPQTHAPFQMRLSLLAAAALLFVTNGQASLVSKGNAVRRLQDGRRRHNYPVALSRRSRSVTKPRRPLRTRAAVPSSQEIINSAFSIATFAPQPLWLMMIGFPNASLTKQTGNSNLLRMRLDVAAGDEDVASHTNSGLVAFDDRGGRSGLRQ